MTILEMITILMPDKKTCSCLTSNSMSRRRYQDISLNPDEITLETPPLSPVLPELELLLSNVLENNPQSNLNHTPQKRRKTGYTRTTKPKYFINNPLGNSPLQANSSLPFSSDIPSSPPWQSQTSMELDLPSQTSMEPDLPPPTQDNDDFYHEFVEAILVNAMPFYSITRDVFVTQGWEVRTGQSNVCFMKSKVFSYPNK